MIDLKGVRVPDHFNGIGVHDTCGCNAGVMSYAEALAYGQDLRAHGITFYKLLVAGTNKVNMAHGLVDAGIVVAVRFYVERPWGRPPQQWVIPVDQVEPYVAVGVQLFELGWNEANIAGEWQGENIPVQAWAIADAVIAAWKVGLAGAGTIPGVKLLFPSMTPGGNVDHRWVYNEIVAKLQAQGLMSTVEHVACHPRPHNNPPLTVWTASNTVTFDEWRWIRDKFNNGCYLWATEHGYSVHDDQNHNYPQIDLQMWTDYNWLLFQWMNPADAWAIEPQLAGFAYWLMEDFGAFNSWEKDCLRGSTVPEMPNPSPLWVRMGERAGELAFSRYGAPQPPAEKPKGFDISQSQVNIRWIPGVTAGNEFAMIRFSTGLILDTGAFTRHMPGSEGKRYIRFGYHAFKASVSAEYQARLLLGLCHEFPVSGAILDAEALGGAITPAMLRKFADTWDSLTSIPFIFYSSPSFIATLTSRGDISFLAKYPLWIAHWGVDAPTLPLPWTKWTFWQTGQALGPEYYLPIDRDLYNGTSAQLWAQFGFIPKWCGDDVEPPQPPTELVIKDRTGAVKDWAWLTAKYGLRPENVTQGTRWRAVMLQEGGFSNSCEVFGKPGTAVKWGWPDGAITELIEPKGSRGFTMGTGGWFTPPNVGPYYIEVEDLRVSGLGMLASTEHEHVDVTIALA